MLSGCATIVPFLVYGSSLITGLSTSTCALYNLLFTKEPEGFFQKAVYPLPQNSPMASRHTWQKLRVCSRGLLCPVGSGPQVSVFISSCSFPLISIHSCEFLSVSSTHPKYLYLRDFASGWNACLPTT